MAKVTIYVPDELKARMDRAGELNWSAAAQRAFAYECSLAEVRMSTENTVISRLRESKVRVEQAQRETGLAAGRKWARQHAEYDELERVAGIPSENREVWDQAGYEEHAAGIFASTIQDVDDQRDVDWEDFWDLIADRKTEPSADWLYGFVEGAGEVWEQVADQV